MNVGRSEKKGRFFLRVSLRSYNYYYHEDRNEGVTLHAQGFQSASHITDYRLLQFVPESQPPESPSGCWVFEGGELVSLMNNATIGRHYRSA